MSPADIAAVLAAHRAWRWGEAGDERTDLSDADLSGADLSDADLSGADLSDADLSGANLRDADLSGADLSDADLSGANLRDADLRDANLRGANLSGANLRDAKGIPPVPFVPDLDNAILTAIDGGGMLKMDAWHTCETTHCRAGWAIHLAGEPGRVLEREMGSCAAGALIYSASTGRVPNFYATDDEAIEDIRACAAKVAP